MYVVNEPNTYMHHLHYYYTGKNEFRDNTGFMKSVKE